MDAVAVIVADCPGHIVVPPVTEDVGASFTLIDLITELTQFEASVTV